MNLTPEETRAEIEYRHERIRKALEGGKRLQLAFAKRVGKRIWWLYVRRPA